MTRPYVLLALVALALFTLLAALLVCDTAFAQDAAPPVIAPASIWYDLWTVIQPVVVLLVSTVGPVLVTWIAARLITLLKITDQNQQADLEAKLRTALHASAVNALRVATVKAGLLPGSVIPPSVITSAVAYVQEKNPDAVAKLGVGESALIDIILSKVPGGTSVVAK